MFKPVQRSVELQHTRWENTRPLDGTRIAPSSTEPPQRSRPKSRQIGAAPIDLVPVTALITLFSALFSPQMVTPAEQRDRKTLLELARLAAV